MYLDKRWKLVAYSALMVSLVMALIAASVKLGGIV